jgi:serine/threonine protein kinase
MQAEATKSWKTYCKKKFSEEETFDIIMRISNGLSTLHKNDMIHRDVHPSRIQLFLDKDGEEHVKFNSIGMPFNFKKLLKRDNFSGHVNYSAPELILEKQVFSNKVDVWSFGCCIFYLITKKDPFEGKQTQETKHNIIHSQFDRYTSIQKFADEKIANPILRSLLFNTLQFSESSRPSFAQIVDIVKAHLQVSTNLVVQPPPP